MEDLREPTHIKRIKRYDIVRRVGEGGMGKVYLGMDRLIRRPVALKLFSLESLPSDGAARDRIIRDFFLEIQTAGALLHPNIVVIHDVGKKGDVLYMVMEFVYGKTLLEYQRYSPRCFPVHRNKQDHRSFRIIYHNLLRNNIPFKGVNYIYYFPI